jgi:hypothetical protein
MPVSADHKQRVLKHACDAAVKKAETTIQQILFALEEATGREIDSVDVDTREFANLRVGIFFNE